jgi:coenzyme F420-reducing hydrogenase gamma subunit
VRRKSKTLVTIGACATSGGIQALRNWQDADEFVRLVYPSPRFISTLKSSTPIAEHVAVDFELRGCPINKHQLVELIAATLIGRRPNIPAYSVCVECKRRGNVCITVARGVPCLGPVTQAGCGALCPSYDRGCYGCYGPMESPNTASLTSQFRILGQTGAEISRAYRNFNAWAWPFRKASEDAEHI